MLRCSITDSSARCGVENAGEHWMDEGLRAIDGVDLTEAGAMLVCCELAVFARIEFSRAVIWARVTGDGWEGLDRLSCVSMVALLGTMVQQRYTGYVYSWLCIDCVYVQRKMLIEACMCYLSSFRDQLFSRVNASTSCIVGATTLKYGSPLC